MIEITRADNSYAYKIESDNPTVIWVRRNIHNARWRRWGPPFSSPEAATDALLKLERPDAAEGAVQP